MLWFNRTEAVKTVSDASFVGYRRKLDVEKIIIRIMIWMAKYVIPSFFQKYILEIPVTFGLTNHSGVVGHDRLVNIFGRARELFGLNRIPGFAKDAGKKYLLKTGDATFHHFKSFGFGDIIRTVIDVAEVNGGSFIIRGRFLNKKTKEVYSEAFQKIAYTDIAGRPVRLPLWLKILIELSCPQNLPETKKNKKEVEKGFPVFEREIVVTSDMTNAEQNVSHDEYAKALTQSIELFLLENSSDKKNSSFSIREGYYKYSRDFFFGDKILIKLYVAEVKKEDGVAVFTAEFCDESGRVHTLGRQKVYQA
jgi:acyl-CoA thioesterase FadM